MNKILCLAAFFVGLTASATITTTNTLNPTTLSGTPSAPATNNSTPVIVGYVNFRFNPNFVINQAGLVSVTGFTNYLKFSLDTNTAFGTIAATNLFSATNSASLTVSPANLSIPVYGWTQTVVTNSTTVWQSVVTGTP